MACWPLLVLHCFLSGMAYHCRLSDMACWSLLALHLPSARHILLYEYENCFTSLSAKSWQYRDRRKPEAGTIPYSYFEWLQGFFIVHSAIGSTIHPMPLNSLEHCICTTTMTNIRPDRDSNLVPSGYKPQSIWMSHRGRPHVLLLLLSHCLLSDMACHCGLSDMACRPLLELHCLLIDMACWLLLALHCLLSSMARWHFLALHGLLSGFFDSIILPSVWHGLLVLADMILPSVCRHGLLPMYCLLVGVVCGSSTVFCLT